MSRNTVQKSRKYYLLDSSYSLASIEDIKSELKSNDTALIKLILENGKKSENYLELFQRRGVSIKKISFEEFYKLPKDSAVLSRRDKRRLKRYNALNNKYEALLINDKPTASVRKKLGKSKFVKLDEKIGATNPFLFFMYPIYTFQDHTLLMYSMYTGNRGIAIPFIYEICPTK